eukprot:CAMPEP_0167748472 /NCGR_PEP_ID=MMETSP0110_2-20121227/4856_1 /TAXON_ID=629695 /ORGANISM="Gymnochlora sp., Strain CCMP2014" /LENGTH=325 /DNA_ID=CAMNT_0007633489 /DNA_START=69 /DNA_END=1043 /DNA_ORIENTATION=-
MKRGIAVVFLIGFFALERESNEDKDKDIAFYDVEVILAPPARISVISVRLQHQVFNDFNSASKNFRLVCEDNSGKIVLNNLTHPSPIVAGVLQSSSCVSDFLFSFSTLLRNSIIEGCELQESLVSPSFKKKETIIRRYRLVRRYCTSSAKYEIGNEGYNVTVLTRTYETTQDRASRTEQVIRNSFLAVAANLRAHLAAESGQQFTLIDAATNQVPGVLIQELADKMIPPVVKTLGKDIPKLLMDNWQATTDSGMITDLMFYHMDQIWPNAVLHDVVAHTTYETRMELECNLQAALNHTLSETVIECLAAPLMRRISNALLETCEW